MQSPSKAATRALVDVCLAQGKGQDTDTALEGTKREGTDMDLLKHVMFPATASRIMFEEGNRFPLPMGLPACLRVS